MAKRILVVDDEELIASTLKKLLVRQGYDAVFVEDGESALEKIKTDDFDLIISDIRMPGMDGVETVSSIRDYLKGSGRDLIPEVFITGYADFEKYEEAKGLKVAGYLNKPFDRDDFLRMIDEILTDKGD